jgi:hypothetical protein
MHSTQNTTIKDTTTTNTTAVGKLTCYLINHQSCTVSVIFVSLHYIYMCVCVCEMCYVLEYCSDVDIRIFLRYAILLFSNSFVNIPVAFTLLGVPLKCCVCIWSCSLHKLCCMSYPCYHARITCACPETQWTQMAEKWQWWDSVV